MPTAYKAMVTDPTLCWGNSINTNPLQSVIDFQHAYNAMNTAGQYPALSETGVFDGPTLTALNLIASMANYGVFNTNCVNGFLGYTPGASGQ